MYYFGDMIQTRNNFIQEMSILEMLIPYFVVPIVFMHTCNILLIIKTKKLHKPSYFLIINLSVGDLILTVTAGFNTMFLDYRNETLIIASNICYNLSLFTTVYIAIDRYIAIRFCLEYYFIVTKRRLVYLIILSWIFSIIIVLLPRFEVPKFGSNGHYRRLSFDIIHYSIVVSSSIILISLSLHTVRIRRKHVKDMRKTSRRFGIVSEKLNTLTRLKESMKDVMKLNIVTVILVISSNIAKFYSNYFAPTKQYVIISMIMFGIYVISNPFLYAVIMTELRQQYIIFLMNIRRYLTLNKSETVRTIWKE